LRRSLSVSSRSSAQPPAFFAATVGLVQTDIKRVVAYSTCSQLGYMFAAEGVGAYNAGIFHLFTHASFKALLFLGAGAVIHALHHEQDLAAWVHCAKCCLSPGRRCWSARSP
jgi:NADH:ubiquinone oxidoreductase subunit 5 (subunit L)/multisubunit Na+/H+ antiporter MnhA subunit